MSGGRPAGVPFWLWPWCLVMLLLPFEELIATTPLELGYKFVLLAAALLLALAPGRPAPAASPRSLAVTALFGLLCLSFFVAPDPAAAWKLMLPTAMLYAGYMLATSVRLDPAHVLVVGRAWMWGAAAAALATLAGGHVNAEGRYYLGLGGATTDPNFLVAEFVFPTAIALYGLGRQGLRLESALCLGLIGAATAATQSRGGAAALVVVLVASLAWQQRWRLLGSLALALAVPAVAFAPLLGRFNLAADPSGSGRTEIWGYALEVVAAHWATGVGPGGFSWLAASAAGLYAAWAPHNTYLQAALEAGVWGLLALGAVFVAHFRIPADHPYAVPVKAGLVGLAVAGCFLHLVAYKLLWLSWAVAAQAAASQPRPQRRPASDWTARLIEGRLA